MHLKHSCREVRFLIFLALVLGLVGSLYVGVTKGSPGPAMQSSQASQEQRGEEALGQACTQCHRLGPIMIQRKTAEQWRDTIYSMISRGAQVMPDEIDPLTVYLTTHFGPDSPPPVFESTGSQRNTLTTLVALDESLPNGPGKAILLGQCVQCHTLEQAVASPRSEAQWEETITKMINFGAPLGPEEQGRLAQYLAEHFGLQR